MYAGVKKVFQTLSLFLLWAEDGGDAALGLQRLRTKEVFFDIKFFASKK